MDDEKLDKLSPLYHEVGLELSDNVGGDPDGAFLYTEVEQGHISLGVFKDEGRSVRYFDPSGTLGDAIYELWNAQEPAKRWAVMEYSVRGTKFHVDHRYPEEIDPNEDEDDRREAAIKRHFGNKPVIYPDIHGKYPDR